eukprot:SAG31_NODE_2787_length_5092_cov_2.933907_2_plen_113_part_00
MVPTMVSILGSYWRITVSCSGVMISAKETQRNLSNEFDAAQQPNNAGKTTPLSPWVVPNDHELRDAAGLQADRDVDESMWRAKSPAANQHNTTDYQAAIDAAVAKLTASNDT